MLQVVGIETLMYGPCRETRALPGCPWETMVKWGGQPNTSRTSFHAWGCPTLHAGTPCPLFFLSLRLKFLPWVTAWIATLNHLSEGFLTVPQDFAKPHENGKSTPLSPAFQQPWDTHKFPQTEVKVPHVHRSGAKTERESQGTYIWVGLNGWETLTSDHEIWILELTPLSLLLGKTLYFSELSFCIGKYYFLLALSLSELKLTHFDYFHCTILAI